MRLLRRISFSLLLGASFLAAQTVVEADAMYAKMRAVGENLKCQCPANCSYTVASCNMLHCSFREQVNPQIRTDLEAVLPEQVHRAIQRGVEIELSGAGHVQNLRVLYRPVKNFFRDDQAAFTSRSTVASRRDAVATATGVRLFSRRV